MLRFVLLSIAAMIIAYWVRKLIMRILTAPSQEPEEQDKPKQPPKTIELQEDEDGVFRPKDKTSNKDDER